MKTDELVTMLATGAGAVESNALTRRFVIATGWGLLGAAALMALLLGVRHDLAQAVAHPMFWVKLTYVAALALAGFIAVSRLSRPGASLLVAAVALAVPVLLMWALAGAELTQANATERNALLYGQTWRSCPLLIAAMSVPAFFATLWAMTGLAPTRLRLAGAGAGLASGTIGAFVYSLHCTEMGAPFLGSWYLLGVLIPTAVGALLGPRLLRW
ncbi:MAG: DUF1109 domain-containing protein [Betaproteobacteria bacterium]